MKQTRLDFRFLSGFLLAHVLLLVTYTDHKVFWYMFTASMLILISFSIVREEIDDAAPFIVYLSYGGISGVILFAFFLGGDYLFNLFRIPVHDDISRLYKLFSPTLFWHYISLMLIAVPGEEIFWRGFVQKRLLKYMGFWSSIFISSIMYASVNVYTGEWILVLATLISGLFWGYLYAWKRSIPLLIVSHLIFDLCLFVFFPF